MACHQHWASMAMFTGNIINAILITAFTMGHVLNYEYDLVHGIWFSLTTTLFS